MPAAHRVAPRPLDQREQPPRLLDIARLRGCEQHGVWVVPHHSPEIHAHLVLALPEVGYCVESHGSGTRDPLPHHVFRERVDFRDGYIHLKDKPGFGLDIDWDAVERYRA